MADPIPEPGIVDKTLIEPIELSDALGRYVFDPKADITPLEAVLIAHMWCAIAIRHLHGKQNRWDWREYLTRDRGMVDWTQLHQVGESMLAPLGVKIDLLRHFKPLE